MRVSVCVCVCVCWDGYKTKKKEGEKEARAKKGKRHVFSQREKKCRECGEEEQEDGTRVVWPL